MQVLLSVDQEASVTTQFTVLTEMRGLLSTSLKLTATAMVWSVKQRL